MRLILDIWIRKLVDFEETHASCIGRESIWVSGVLTYLDHDAITSLDRPKIESNETFV